MREWVYVDVSRCEACGALVEDNYRAKHLNFHASIANLNTAIQLLAERTGVGIVVDGRLEIEFMPVRTK